MQLKVLNNMVNSLPQIGEALNLLTIENASSWGHPFGVPKAKPLITKSIKKVTTAGNWQALEVSMHKSLESLVQAVSRYNVLPVPLEKHNATVIPDLLNDIDSTEEDIILKTFGIPYEDGAYYLLLKCNREDSVTAHPAINKTSRSTFLDQWELSPSWLKHASRLRSGKRIQSGYEHDAVLPLDKNSAYLNAIYEFGSHFVSQVTMGNSLMQLVRLQPNIAQEVYEHWYNLGNGTAINQNDLKAFRNFTGANIAQQVSRICCSFPDPTIEDLYNNGFWSDKDSLAGESLLNLLATDLVTKTQTSNTTHYSGPINVEISSLGRYLEFYRAINFERVLKGALLQRWGSKVCINANRLSSLQECFDTALFNDSTSLSKTNVLNLAANKTATINKWSLSHYVQGSLSSKEAQILEFEADTNLQCPLFCKQMSGIVYLKNIHSKEQFTLLDGLCFASTTSQDGINKIVITQDIYQLPAKAVTQFLPFLQEQLLEIHSYLIVLPASAYLKRETLSNFAIWLANLLSEYEGIAFKNNSDYAHYLAVIPAIALDTTYSYDLASLLKFKDSFNAVNRLLNTAAFDGIISHYNLPDKAPIDQSSLETIRLNIANHLIDILTEEQKVLLKKARTNRTHLSNCSKELLKIIREFDKSLAMGIDNQLQQRLKDTMRQAASTEFLNDERDTNGLDVSDQKTLTVQSFIDREAVIKKHIEAIKSATEQQDVYALTNNAGLEELIKGFPKREKRLWDFKPFDIDQLGEVLFCEASQNEPQAISLLKAWLLFEQARIDHIKIAEAELRNTIEQFRLRQQLEEELIKPIQQAYKQLFVWIAMLIKYQEGALFFISQDKTQLTISNNPELLRNTVETLDTLLGFYINQQKKSYKKLLMPYGIQ